MRASEAVQCNLSVSSFITVYLHCIILWYIKLLCSCFSLLSCNNIRTDVNYIVHIHCVSLHIYVSVTHTNTHSWNRDLCWATWLVSRPLRPVLGEILSLLRHQVLQALWWGNYHLRPFPLNHLCNFNLEYDLLFSPCYMYFDNFICWLPTHLSPVDSCGKF